MKNITLNPLDEGLDPQRRRHRRHRTTMRLPQLNKANRLARRLAEGRTIITTPRPIERAFSLAS